MFFCLAERPHFLIASLLLVAIPLLLVAMPGATGSVLATKANGDAVNISEVDDGHRLQARAHGRVNGPPDLHGAAGGGDGGDSCSSVYIPAVTKACLLEGRGAHYPHHIYI